MKSTIVTSKSFDSKASFNSCILFALFTSKSLIRVIFRSMSIKKMSPDCIKPESANTTPMVWQNFLTSMKHMTSLAGTSLSWHIFLAYVFKRFVRWGVSFVGSPWLEVPLFLRRRTAVLIGSSNDDVGLEGGWTSRPGTAGPSLLGVVDRWFGEWEVSVQYEVH
jgi:hypothetical protein